MSLTSLFLSRISTKPCAAFVNYSKLQSQTRLGSTKDVQPFEEQRQTPSFRHAFQVFPAWETHKKTVCHLFHSFALGSRYLLFAVSSPVKRMPLKFCSVGASNNMHYINIIQADSNRVRASGYLQMNLWYMRANNGRAWIGTFLSSSSCCVVVLGDAEMTPLISDCTDVTLGFATTFHNNNNGKLIASLTGFRIKVNKSTIYLFALFK